MSNLTAGLTYGRGRLCDKLRTRNRRPKTGNSRVSVQVFNPHDQAPVFLKTVATKREPLASDELDRIRLATVVSPDGKAILTSGVNLEPPRPPDDGRQMAVGLWELCMSITSRTKMGGWGKRSYRDRGFYTYPWWPLLSLCECCDVTEREVTKPKAGYSDWRPVNREERMLDD